MEKICIRTVRLYEGPLDGQHAVVSHSTAIVAKCLYVWDGDVDQDHFVYAKNLIDRFTESEKGEFQAAQAWLKEIIEGNRTPMPKIRAWIINLAVAIAQFGVDYSSQPGG
jgi:hypothetical protein